MGTTRYSIFAIAFLLSLLFLWTTVTKALPCEECTTRKCTLNCGSFPGKRSEVLSREDLNDLRKNKPSPGIQWTGSKQCTLDVWFQELPLEWQRHIIGIFELASKYTDTL